MNKKIIVMMVACGLLLAGGVAGMWYFSQVKNKKTGNGANYAGGAAGQNGRGAGVQNQRRPAGFNGLSGKIIGKDDTSITVQNSKGGSAIVFYSENTKIMKIEDGQAGDLAVGQTVMARGAKNEDGNIYIESLQIRPQTQPAERVGARADGQKQTMAQRYDGRRAEVPQNNDEGRNAPADNGQGFISGQLAAIDGGKITIKSFNGERTVVLSSDAKISKFADAAAGDLAEGTEVFVSGTKNNDGSLTAQTIQIGGPGIMTARP